MNLTQTRRSRKGFTLVELLVVVLIIAILAAIALPLYLGATQDAAVKTARANMQTIANAEQAFKVKDASHAYTADLGTTSPLISDLGAIPAGPGNRQYTVTLAGAGGGTACDAQGNGSTPVSAPSGSFTVTSTGSDGANDGCFIPGISH